MVKLRQLIAGLMTATVLVSSTTPVDAQKRSTGVGSLGEMSCQTAGEGHYKVINKDFPIALQILRGIAKFTVGPGTLIYKNKTGQVVCRVTEAGQRSVYKTLNLKFGIADNGRYADGALVRLSIYRDGNFHRYEDITKGKIFILPIDISNVRSIALEAECLRGGVKSKDHCPELIFFEDILE